MEGFGSFFNDPDFQKRLQDMAEQMQSTQNLAWADNAIKLAVDMTVAAINRVNLQGNAEEQAKQVRSVMATYAGQSDAQHDACMLLLGPVEHLHGCRGTAEERVRHRWRTILCAASS